MTSESCLYVICCNKDQQIAKLPYEFILKAKQILCQKI
jgi:hypothetical protein